MSLFENSKAHNLNGFISFHMTKCRNVATCRNRESRKQHAERKEFWNLTEQKHIFFFFKLLYSGGI